MKESDEILNDIYLNALADPKVIGMFLGGF